jgi:hypothetical protein
MHCTSLLNPQPTPTMSCNPNLDSFSNLPPQYLTLVGIGLCIMKSWYEYESEYEYEHCHYCLRLKRQYWNTFSILTYISGADEDLSPENICDIPLDSMYENQHLPVSMNNIYFMFPTLTQAKIQKYHFYTETWRSFEWCTIVNSIYLQEMTYFSTLRS